MGQAVFIQLSKVRCCIILIFLFVCQAGSGVYAQGNNIAVQRGLFVQIEKTLQAGQTKTFSTYVSKLRDYPLYPYLQFHEHKLRIDHLSESEVMRFLTENRNTPVGERLRYEWLLRLAREKRWKSYADFYIKPLMIQDKTLACYYATALMHIGDTVALKQVIPTLWSVNFSQPPQCDAVFNWGFSKMVINDQLIWRRLLLVWGRDAGLTRYLKERLSRKNRHWYHALVEAKRHPEKTLRKLLGQSLQPDYALDIIAYAVKRLAADKIQNADRLWAELRAQYQRQDAMYQMQRDLGVMAATQLAPDIALRWLSDIPAAYHDSTSRHWQIRSALRSLDWRAVSEGIGLLPENERGESRWQYWYARSLDRMGRREEAFAIWNTLAQETGYYNYLAADQLGASYRLETQAIPYTEENLKDFLNTPAVSRMQELIALGRFVDARREFLFALENFSTKDFSRLAILADRWQWSDGAIRSVAQSKFRGDTLLRFPIPYYKIVQHEADRHSQISMPIIYGVMRRESAFMDKAKSPAGALGLMQLMPHTARLMIKELKLKRPSTWYILRPDVNIRMGTAYLAKMYRQHRQHLPLALASYNAGTTAVRRWTQRAPIRDPAIWIETIPFNETRRYLQAVLYYIVIYAHRLGSEKPIRLEPLMTLP